MKNHRPVKTIPKSFQFITELLFSECKLFSSESISIHIVANNSVQWIISLVYSSKHVLLNMGLVLSSRGPLSWEHRDHGCPDRGLCSDFRSVPGNHDRDSHPETCLRLY